MRPKVQLQIGFDLESWNLAKGGSSYFEKVANDDDEEQHEVSDEDLNNWNINVNVDNGLDS